MNPIDSVGRCRINQSDSVIPVLDLGTQRLTGVFPKTVDQVVTSGPLGLVWCPDSGLLQLSHSYDLGEMYGENYGYRSGLNQSMVEHLRNKVRDLLSLRPLSRGDLVVDIGSNDGTLLGAYTTDGIFRLGIDPTGEKFKEFYEPGIELVADFFSADRIRNVFPSKKARIITSISMFYDLEDPNKFVSDIAESLAPDGIWHFEQSYMPTMLRMNSYDTVCHEHLEYYSLRVVQNLLHAHGLQLVDVQMNSVNGGSFAVTAALKGAKLEVNTPVIDWMLRQEERMGLDTVRPYLDFSERVKEHREELVALIRSLVADGRKVVGYGASTKGNVILQYCGFTSSDISCIAEVNPDKYGCYTPGTLIPILSEEEVRRMRPDYMLVLPWHFRDSIIRRESGYLASGGKLIFPLPYIEIV
jgi:SAM-dependent methyltransferase